MKYHSYFSILFQPIRTILVINKAVATNSSWSTRSKSNHCYTILRASAFEFCFQANENVLLMRFNSCPFSYAVAWNSFPVSSFIWRKEELNEAKACPSPPSSSFPPPAGKRRGEIPYVIVRLIEGSSTLWRTAGSAPCIYVHGNRAKWRWLLFS